jgi:hypothetical protein
MLTAAELVIMKRVGHTPQLELPWPTARMIERFAARLDAG